MRHHGKCIGGPKDNWQYASDAYSFTVPHNADLKYVNEYCAEVIPTEYVAVYTWNHALQAWLFEGIVKDGDTG